MSENNTIRSNEEVAKSLGYSPKAMDKHAETLRTVAGEDVSKALTTGHEINSENMTGAAAYRRQYLNNDIKMHTFNNEEFTIFSNLAQASRQVYSTVEEHIVYESHGEIGHTRFVREIGVAPERDPRIKRKNTKLKFVSDTRRASIASQIVDNVADIIPTLNMAAMTTIAKTIEWAAFYGDASLSADETKDGGKEFDGIARLIDQKTNVMDVRGQSLTKQMLNQAALIVSKAYGKVTDAYMPIGVQTDFANNHNDHIRIIQQMPTEGMQVGLSIDSFQSTRGPIKLHGSSIMENDQILTDDNYVASPSAPQPATVTGTPQTANGGTFREEDQKVQSYKVVVWSDEHRSVASEATEVTVANATDSVTLSITLASMYNASPSFVEVFRMGTELSKNSYYKIARIPVSKADNGVITFIDRNETIPETVDVFVGQMDTEVVQLLELLPLMRLPLARTNASDVFSYLWYGALALYHPKRWVRIKNVKYVEALSADNAPTQYPQEFIQG